MIVTTTAEIPNCEIKAILGIVNGATHHSPQGAFSENLSKQDWVIDTAIEKAKDLMIKKAEALRADAIIGVSVSALPIGGDFISLYVVGTAVKLRKSDKAIEKEERLQEESLSFLYEKDKQRKDELASTFGRSLSINGASFGTTDVYDEYKNAPSKKNFLLEIISICSDSGGCTVNELCEIIGNKPQVMEIAPYIEKLLSDGDIQKDEETKKYHIKSE